MKYNFSNHKQCTFGSIDFSSCTSQILEKSEPTNTFTFSDDMIHTRDRLFELDNRIIHHITKNTMMILYSNYKLMRRKIEAFTMLFVISKTIHFLLKFWRKGLTVLRSLILGCPNSSLQTLKVYF